MIVRDTLAGARRAARAPARGAAAHRRSRAARRRRSPRTLGLSHGAVRQLVHRARDDAARGRDRDHAAAGRELAGLDRRARGEPARPRIAELAGDAGSAGIGRRRSPRPAPWSCSRAAPRPDRRSSSTRGERDRRGPQTAPRARASRAHRVAPAPAPAAIAVAAAPAATAPRARLRRAASGRRRPAGPARATGAGSGGDDGSSRLGSERSGSGGSAAGRAAPARAAPAVGGRAAPGSSGTRLRAARARAAAAARAVQRLGSGSGSSGSGSGSGSGSQRLSGLRERLQRQRLRAAAARAGGSGASSELRVERQPAPSGSGRERLGRHRRVRLAARAGRLRRRSRDGRPTRLGHGAARAAAPASERSTRPSSPARAALGPTTDRRACERDVADAAVSRGECPRTVGYVLMGFPRVSETFIASEIHRVEQAGIRVRLFVIKPVEEREARAPPPGRRRDPRRSRSTCPTRRALTAPLHRWRPAAPAAVRARRSGARCAAARAGLARAAATRARPGAARPPHAALRPAQDLRQGAAPGDRARRPAARRARRPPPARALRARHDDRDVARRADRRRCRSPSPATRATSTRRELNPQRLAAAQAARRARSPSRAPRRTSRHLRRIAPRGATCTSSTTASTPTSRGCSTASPRRHARPTARCGSSASGGSWPRRASTCSSTPARVLQRRGVPFEAADRRPGRQARRRDPAARSRRHGLDGRVRLPGPDRPGRAARRVPARERAVHAVPAAARRPRRHPQRARRGDGGRRARRRHRASPASPSSSRDGVNGLLVAPDDPEALADALSACTRTARWRRGWPTRAARPCASASTATRLAGELAALFEEAIARDRTAIASRRVRVCVTEHLHRDRERAEAVAAGRFTHAGRDARRSAPSPTGSAPTCPPTRSGGSSGSSSPTASTSPTPTRRPATQRFRTRGSGSSRSWIRAGAARPRRRRGHRAPDPQLDLRLAGASARAARPGSTPRCCAASPHRRATCASNLTPERNHRTLELYALLIAALALPDARPGGALLGFAVAELDRNLAHGLPRRRRPPRGLDALPPDRPALVRRRARERPPLRPRAARTASTTGSRARATSRVHCHRPDGRIPALSDADTGRLLRAARAGRRAARRRRGDPHAELPRRRLLRPAQRLGRRRPLPDLRLRPARRRRPRPLRPAQLRGVRRRAPAASSTPAASPTPRSRRTCAAGSAARPRTTRSASTGSTRRPYTRTRPEGPGRRGPLPRPHHRARARRARRRGAQPGLRRGPPAPDRVRRRPLLGDRGPAARRARAPLRPALPPRAGAHARRVAGDTVRAPGLALLIARRRRDRARARLGLARATASASRRRWSAPSPTGARRDVRDRWWCRA